jgi:hypothetical protein
MYPVVVVEVELTTLVIVVAVKEALSTAAVEIVDQLSGISTKPLR